MDSDHRLVVTPIRLKLMNKTVNPAREEGSALMWNFCYRIRGEWTLSVLELAQEHLQGRRKKQRKWMTEDTIEIIEAKRMAFLRWQEQREDAGRCKEYRDLSKRVRGAVKEDKEKWLDGVMKGLEDGMKRHWQGRFFKKLKHLTDNKVTPMRVDSLCRRVRRSWSGGRTTLRRY